MIPQAQNVAQLLNASDLFDLASDGMRHELVQGELTTMPPASAEHGSNEMNLLAAIHHHARANQLGRVFPGDTGFLLATDPDTVRSPDVGFVSQAKLDQHGLTKEFFPAAPDLVVEVLSPNDRVGEVDAKIQEWIDAGSRLVWVVRPQTRTVIVHQACRPPELLNSTEFLDGLDVLPGFRMKVSEVFW